MKQIIVIGTYPSSPEKEKILSECIDRLSNIGYDIMVVSHYPLPTYIQEKVNYCIYDKENIFLPTELTPSYWFETNIFHTEIFSEGHLITCSKNMFTALNLANALKYDFFYYMESDNFLESEDIQKMETLKESMFEEKKHMIFFKQKDGDSLTYNTLLFGGKPNYFVNNMFLPVDLEDYKANLGPFWTIERLFYYYLSKDESDFIIIPQNIQSYFTHSKMNIITHEYFIEVIGNSTKDQLFLWISNGYQDLNDIKVNINSGEDLILSKGGWMLIPKNVGDEFYVDVEENGYFVRKNFKITEENKDKYYAKGKITFK
jgi:hypothetical protein